MGGPRHADGSAVVLALALVGGVVAGGVLGTERAGAAEGDRGVSGSREPREVALGVAHDLAEPGHRLDPRMTHTASTPPPGIVGRQIHLATVITPGAPAYQRDAMLRVLQAYFRSVTPRRPHHSHAPELSTWVLHVWQLEGLPSSWRAQLAQHYRERPVFALVSGIGGEWQPVHRFCEEERIPCLLPNVDTPPESRPGGYSLYFSAGTTIESAAIAARLARAGPQRVLQVFVRGSEAETIARSLSEKLRDGGHRSVDLALWPGESFGTALIAQRADDAGATAVILWLASDDLQRMRNDSVLRVPTYFSSTLLEGELSAAKALDVPNGVVVQPFAPRAEAELRFRRVASWLTSHRIRAGERERRIEDQTFFALSVLREILHHGVNVAREGLLESLDHSSGFERLSSFYPKLNFAPGERVLSKGCYLVPLKDGERAEWLVP